jgi:DNA-binding NarL/FixJ family response regulator
MASVATPDSGDLERCGVLAVDDHDAFRRIVRTVVDAADRFELVGEAASGEEAVELASRVAPDLVLMDVRMPGIGGVEAARRVRELIPSAVIVLISVDGAGAMSASPRAVGADDIMSKHALTPRSLSTLWLRHRPRRQHASRRTAGRA